jgi:rapamycin-insensitive companion of mTOR
VDKDQLEQAKQVIIILLKSWKGLIYLVNEKIALKSLFHVLKQTKQISEDVKNAIFEIIQEALKIGMMYSDVKHNQM